MQAGRPREFDEGKALDAAMRLFWARGYHATSISDLTEATGVYRNSLYATFGDKKTLFLRALDHYMEGAAARFAERLAPPTPALEGLREALKHYSRIVASASGPRGCLATNTTIELLPQERDVAARIARGFRGMIDMIEDAVRRGQREGSIKRDLVPRDAALYLYSFAQGLRVAGRVTTMAELEPTLDLALAGLVA
jgi:TetR/AcrR family transcriptional repressor of nem operon